MDIDYGPFFSWVEETLGGRITANARQGARRSGGRPAFFLDVDTGGDVVPCYARMSRGMESHDFSLEREHALLEELADAGIRVPRPYGYCADPAGILMECLSGEDDYGKITDAAQRDTIDNAFVQELARQHELDAKRFEARGFEIPVSREEFALANLALWEGIFESSIREPVPAMRFAVGWLHRNVPERPERAVLVQGDTGPGQFMFEGDRLTGIIDWEFAHLGDPMLDLGLIRGRDFYNPGADLEKWFALYERYSGTPIDEKRLRYYTVRALIITPLALAGMVQNMGPRTDHAEWYAQNATYKRATIEALAEALGVDLQAQELPEPPPSDHATLFDILVDNLRDEQMPEIEDEFLRYRMGLSLRLVQFLRNAEHMGPTLREMELDDMASVLGSRPASRSEGLVALDRLAAESGPEREEELVRYFHRNAVREEALLGGGLGAGEGAVFQRMRLGR